SQILIYMEETRPGTDPLHTHVIESALQVGQQTGLDLVPRSKACVPTLGGKGAVAGAVIYKEGFAQPGAGSHHRDGATGYRLTGVEVDDLGGFEARHRLADCLQIVHQMR